MNPTDLPIADYLKQRESELVERIEEVRRGQLVPLEAELANVRKARAAISDRSGTPSLRFGRLMTPPAIFAGGDPDTRITKVDRQPSPYANLTQQQLVLRALKERFHNGATVNELVDFFHNAWDRKDIVRSSLSPQLSRLRTAHRIRLAANNVWKLVSENDEAPPNRSGGASHSSSAEEDLLG